MQTRLFALLSTILFLAGSLAAQTLGDVSGEVRDASGAQIPGVKVIITNTATGGARDTLTNDSGVYAFPALTPGAYTLRAEKQGFKSASSTSFDLQVQQSARLDLTLEVGSTTDSVEVNASGAILQTENATVGTVVEQKRIVELPLNGRNYLALTALAPNVSFGFPSAGQADGRQGGDRANQNISVAGQRNNFNRFTLDGVENTDPNFNTYVIFPSAEALQEFKVQSGVYPAEFGRGATQINVSTKGGGNAYHGALYEFLRNDKLDAKNYAFTTNRPRKDPFKWNQFGFVLSGPVTIPKLFDGKNRLFFMTNYEWFRQRRQVQGVYNLPSVAMRGGNFNEVPLGIFDPLTRAPSSQNGVNFTAALPFPNNTIPTSRFNPISQRLLAFYPSPNLPGLQNNYTTALGRPVDKDQFIQRFDFVESSKSNWFGRYSRSEENQINENLFQNGEAIITKATQWMFSNTRVLTNSLVNEFRFGRTSFYNTTGPELAFKTDVVGALGIPGLASGPPVQWGIPSVGIDTFSGFGNSSEGPYENNNSAMQFINNVSWIRGKHNIKFGGEVRRDAYNQVGNQFARGQFSFITTSTNSFRLENNTPRAFGGNAFADYHLGQINQSEAAVAIGRAQFRATGFAFFIDDTWRVSSKLTLSMGLRYENTPPWEDQTGTLFNAIVPNDIRPTDFRNAPVTDLSLHPYFMRQGPARQNCYEGINIRWIANPNAAFAAPFGAPRTRCDGSLSNRLVARDNNDWAPRFGASYQLNDKTVIRTGVGMFYSQDTGNPRFDMARNIAGRLRDNANTLTPNLTWQNSLASIAGGVAGVFTPYSFANPYDRRTPYSMQYIFNVQREISKDLVAEVGYIGSISHRLEGLRAINESLPAPRALGIPERQRAPFPQFGRIQLVDNGGNGNYNSLGAKLTKRYSAGLTMLMSYTWARAIDTSSAIRNQGGDTLFPQNSYCRACERARSSFDTNQRFVTSFQWELPFGRGKRFDISNKALNAIAGGWEVGSIITLQSGFPMTVTQSGDPSNTGGQFDRPIASGAKPELPRGEQDPQRFFNTAAYLRTPDGSFGNVGRNTLDSPGIIGWDSSLMKNFIMPYSETHRLQFRFEGFNMGNHPNWGNPNTNLNAGVNFGTITGTRTNMRQLQLALRYTF